MPKHPLRDKVIGVLIGLVVGAATVALVWATSGGSAEVRVVGRVLDDGSVEVRLQQRAIPQESELEQLEEPAWSERIAPTARIIPADATPNRWYVSSGVVIELSEPEPPNVGEIGPYEISGTPTINRPVDEQTLLCVITHGEPADFFWFQVYSAFLDSERWHDIDLRAEMYKGSADQADGIKRCVEDGAAAIATTLADPEALKPALDSAREAGVRLVTFNSGAEQASELGAIAHVSLDEAAVGRIAAQEFIQRGVSGDILCIIHEPSNTGLEQRCDVLDARYEHGDVIRVRVSDASDPVAEIAARATAEVGGAIALNANTAYQMADALNAERPDIVLAAVSADFPRPLAMLFNGRLSFVLWSHALEQGYLTTTALLYGHGTPFPRETGLFTQATQVSIQPTVITPEAVRALFAEDNPIRATLPAWFDALEQAIENEQPSSGDGN